MRLHGRHAAWAAPTVVLGLAGAALAAGPASAAPEGRPGTASAGAYLAPYYTEADLTGDDRVTDADVSVLEKALGTRKGAAGWSAVAAADLDGDGVITVADVAALAQRELYDDGTFDLVEASAVDIQAALNAGVVTSVQITKDYLDRIAAYDHTAAGGTDHGLNSILTTAPDALAQAAASDARRAAGTSRGMLDGIPVVLKDNYDTADMPTTAGCECLRANQTSDDAFMVTGLRDAGAVVLGKASLDEFATGFSSEYSLGTRKADGTMGAAIKVYSPYNLTKTAGGSSGGTGASIAANLAAIGFGTDTGGSIRDPSSYNQLVGVRPTVGLTSRDGIVPLALTQDTGGPLARSVSDAAVALDAVVGADANDAVTAAQAGKVPASYTSYLDPDALEGARFGYLPSTVGTNATVKRLFDQAVVDLEAQGATVVDLSKDPATPTAAADVATIGGISSGSTNEFKANLNVYLTQHAGSGVPYKTLTDLVADNLVDPSYSAQYKTRNAVTDAQYQAWMTQHTADITKSHATLTADLDAADVDALIYPTTGQYTTQGTNLRLSPNTGMPAVTLPMGQSDASLDGTAAVAGAGVNLELLGRKFDEGPLLGLAYAYEQATHHRTTPASYGALAGDVVAGPGTDDDAAGDGSVALTTSASSKVRTGETFTVTVAQDAADLYAYRASVDYDDKDLRLVKVESGTTGTDDVAQAAGSVTLTHTKRGSSPSAEGATDLVTLTFQAVHAGRASIALTGLTTVTSKAVATPVRVAGQELSLSTAGSPVRG